MGSESPVVLVDLGFSYLPFDHVVRKQIRKTQLAERQRRACKAARTGTTKLAILDDYLRFAEELPHEI